MAAELFKVAEVAAAWRCSTKHIYDLIHSGQLGYTNLSGRTGARAKVRISQAQMDAYAKQTSTSPRAKRTSVTAGAA